MKFGVLALDYDGTIACDGVLDPDEKAAVAEVRAGGITVILVTGRRLPDLRRVTDDLQFVDAVVAENGALLAFPKGKSWLVGHAPSPALLEELRKGHIDFSAGQCVVEADATLAPQLLAVIRELELPLVLNFNRGRVMMLPQAVSKATGLRSALRALRLLAHNAIAIGDAENDHELLAACEIGVAVGWGSPALQRKADEVLRGDGPKAVAVYIREAANQLRLPSDRIGRKSVSLGVAEGGDQLALAISGRNIFIAGDTRSGKSELTGLLCEQMILQGYSLCVIDPEGGCGELEALPGVFLFGTDYPPPHNRRGSRSAPSRHERSDRPFADAIPGKGRVSEIFFAHVGCFQTRHGFPHGIVIDEAHYYLHDTNFERLLDLDFGAHTCW